MPRLSAPGVAFLDRDGTINEKPPEGEYITDVVQLRLLPGAATAIRHLNDAGVLAIVVTNQRGIALGKMSENDVATIHAQLSTMLDQDAGARIDAVFCCPHDRDQCDCRKPSTGLFHQARDRFPWIDFARSAMIGDGESDVQAAHALGMRAVWLGVDVSNLGAAVDQLLT